MMDALLREWIREIFEQNTDLLAIAVRQRAKFEGWLKFELALMAEKRGAQEVEVEAQYPNSKKRADIGFRFGNEAYFIELKTANTNWRVAGVKVKHRPITRNIRGVINDVRKLDGCGCRGIVAFALFPLVPGDKQWHKYLRRIADETGLSLSETEHCFRWRVPLAEKAKAPTEAEMVVCAFATESTIKEDSRLI